LLGFQLEAISTSLDLWRHRWFLLPSVGRFGGRRVTGGKKAFNPSL
jgi:hypothetical protein